VNDDALETAPGLLGGGAFPNSACLAAADDDDA